MERYGLLGNVILFALGAGAIWWAGARLEHGADVIARRTRLGSEFTGMLLLAGVTSLPELATTFTSIVILQNPTLAVYNLLGGVALQTAILAWADLRRGEGALTYFSPAFVLLIEGVGLIMLLQLAVVGIAASGTPTVVGVSPWLFLLVLTYAGMMYLVYRYRGQPRWTPELADDFPAERSPEDVEDPVRDEPRPLGKVWLAFAGLALVVLAGGWLAAETAEVLAEVTGLGDAFLGATLLALATSLPEVSTTTAAVTSGRDTVAISNIFGSNAFDVSLLFVADLLYRADTVLAGGDASLVLVGCLASAMTCIYLWGLIERENRSVLGVGWDSAAVVVVYGGGMVALYLT